MKALSLKQPYAELIMQGKKTIELRKWNTSFRGPFLIHASKNHDKQAMKKWKFKKLPTGCIIGKAILNDVRYYATKKEHDRDQEYHCASYEWGSYGFILSDPKRVSLIPCKGRLGFWEATIKDKP